ncbi:MAG: YggS family pyridoxal phosphate-dependent enzyme [Ruminococcus sp.]|nr:YggS family pyridoxal phosphate-dependent enzyme [Ruminococcus sp.]
MITNFNYIDENFKRIRENVNNSIAKYRKSIDDVRIMAVTKTVQPEAVNHAITLGIDLLGENKVQEYLSKKDLYYKSAEMNFIGRLQTNKVKYIINDMSLIHSVDSIKLAQEINRLALKNSKVQDVLVEVNIAGEESKAGVKPELLKDFLLEVSTLENIRVKGLMTLPPANSGDKFLAKMQELYIDISEEKLDNISMTILSMGTSGDYTQAIKYGSTLVRIGTALFGARTYL